SAIITAINLPAAGRPGSPGTGGPPSLLRMARGTTMMRSGRFGLRLALILGAAAVLAGPAAAGNWPRFRGPHGTGVSDDKDIPVEWADKDVLWKTALPGLGNSSPVVWGDRLFIQSATADGKERLLLGLDVATGKVRWQKSVPGERARIHPKNTLATSTPA